MNAIFKHTSSYWVRYSDYVWKHKKGVLYLTPAENATIKLYDPLKDNNADEMVLEAVKIGRKAMNEKTEKEENKANILEFVRKYGLLGFMTAIPTTFKINTTEN